MNRRENSEESVTRRLSLSGIREAKRRHSAVTGCRPRDLGGEMVQKVKAHCSKYNKWYVLEVNGTEVVNFVDISEEMAKGLETERKETSFRVSPKLLPCDVCGSRKAGTCSHIERLGKCRASYNYQCLFCDQLKISRSKATGRFTKWAGTNLIPGAATDRFGNAQGSQYDLAQDGGFKGFKLVILCLYHGENILPGLRKYPIPALERKGFNVLLLEEASPWKLEQELREACQLWVISDTKRHLNQEHLNVIMDFYNRGGNLYLFGDNEPYYADANYLAEVFLGTSLSGNKPGRHVIGIKTSQSSPGILGGHLISTGIVNFYEGSTISEVKTTSLVKPLVTSSENTTVTGMMDEGGHRILIDGGFTRLFYKWDTAGTDRFIVNAAAWLADGSAGSEVSFT